MTLKLTVVLLPIGLFIAGCSKETQGFRSVRVDTALGLADSSEMTPTPSPFPTSTPFSTPSLSQLPSQTQSLSPTPVQEPNPDQMSTPILPAGIGNRPPTPLPFNRCTFAENSLSHGLISLQSSQLKIDPNTCKYRLHPKASPEMCLSAGAGSVRIAPCAGDDDNQLFSANPAEKSLVVAGTTYSISEMGSIGPALQTNADRVSSHRANDIGGSIVNLTLDDVVEARDFATYAFQDVSSPAMRNIAGQGAYVEFRVNIDVPGYFLIRAHHSASVYGAQLRAYDNGKEIGHSYLKATTTRGLSLETWGDSILWYAAKGEHRLRLELNGNIPVEIYGFNLNPVSENEELRFHGHPRTLSTTEINELSYKDIFNFYRATIGTIRDERGWTSRWTYGTSAWLVEAAEEGEYEIWVRYASWKLADNSGFLISVDQLDYGNTREHQTELVLENSLEYQPSTKVKIRLKKGINQIRLENDNIVNDKFGSSGYCVTHLYLRKI